MLPAITVGSKLLALISHWLLVPALVDAVVEEMELEDIDLINLGEVDHSLYSCFPLCQCDIMFCFLFFCVRERHNKVRLITPESHSFIST